MRLAIALSILLVAGCVPDAPIPGKDIARIHEAARGPPMDYRDNPKHRALLHIKWAGSTPPQWCTFAPASGVFLLRR